MKTKVLLFLFCFINICCMDDDNYIERLKYIKLSLFVVKCPNQYCRKIFGHSDKETLAITILSHVYSLNDCVGAKLLLDSLRSTNNRPLFEEYKKFTTQNAFLVDKEWNIECDCNKKLTAITIPKLASTFMCHKLKNKEHNLIGFKSIINYIKVSNPDKQNYEN